MSDIPKIIHYCWFGGKPMPELAKKCMESWKKYLPDYEIKEWNEENFDIYSCCYVQEAYEAKKWAFVSDYARFHILYQEGGLYFDTDVELINPIHDIIERGAFMGCENEPNRLHGLGVNPGLGMGACAGLPLYAEVLEEYHQHRFFDKNGKADQTTIVERMTELLTKKGLKNKYAIQEISNIYIYPKEYFCPTDTFTMDVNFTENTRSIHHFSGSWLNSSDRHRNDLKTKFYKYLKPILGQNIAKYASTFFAYMKVDGFIELSKKVMHIIMRKGC